MNRKRTSIVLLILLVGVFVGIRKSSWFQPKPMESAQVTKLQAATPPAKAPEKQPDTPPQGIVIPDVPGHKLSNRDKTNIAKIVQVFSAPIDFWGKVIDQNGNPVPYATVNYSVIDKYFKDGTKSSDTSDANGLFSKNARGAALYINVAKQGYYGTPQSGRGFGYGTPSGEAPPSKQKPAIFVLQKMGETEPLIKLGTGGVLVPKDGTLKKLSLRRERGRLLEARGSDLQVELWSGYQPPPPYGQKYDWKCRISVPGGGLIERVGEFNFEAPAENYSNAFEYNMPATTERWQSALEKEFFLSLADGCYARIKLNVIPGGDIFVTLESYLNPVPGHRNLEFDPSKAIKPSP